MANRVAFTISLIFALLFVATRTPVRAQDVRAFDQEQVPSEGSKVQDFVPRSWKIDARADGDLNGDGLADHVLQLVPEDYDSTGITAGPESQALLILFSASDGRLKRAGLAVKLLVSLFPQYIIDISIKNRVLVIHQNYGMTDVTDLTHRFRYEPEARRFLLIGKDTFLYHRPQGPRWPATRISENYLTGVRLTTTDNWLKNGTNRPTTTRESVAHTRVFLEDVDEDPDS